MRPIPMARDDLPERVNRVTGEIVSAAYEVHSELGPGLLESNYEECMASELVERGCSVLTQVSVPLLYKGRTMSTKFRLDVLVDDLVVVEIKTVEALHLVHFAQLMTYLRASQKPVGLLINFNELHLKHGIRRVVAPQPHSVDPRRVRRVRRDGLQGD